MTTLYDVAREAKVSIKTVSRVLNNTDKVKEDTVKRVKEAMSRLDYHPNATARNLKRRKTDTIGFVVPFGSRFVFADPGMQEQMRGAHDVLTRAGYDMILTVPENGDRFLTDVVRLTRTGNVDGVILYGMAKAVAIVREFSKKGYRFVSLGYSYPHQTHNYVEIDAEAAGYLATRYLLSQGRHFIGLTQEPENFLFLNKVSVEVGYCRALNEEGLPYRSDLVSRTDFTVEGGYRATLELLEQNQKIDALICCSDPTAFGALRALRERGICPKKDILLLTGDRLPLIQAVEPWLGGIHNPLYEQGRLAAEMIIRIIQEGKDLPGVVLRPDLVIT
jgi:DNA-binding LacI/PurR family transcriptional regulator